MRLLTHNTLKCNTEEAKGKGYPLIITAIDVRVDDDNQSMDENRQIAFIRKTLPMIDWPALVQGATQLGIPTLPHVLTDELVQDNEFCKALFHILMNIHLVEGSLKCPITGRMFPVQNEIPNMMLEEEECERIRY